MKHLLIPMVIGLAVSSGCHRSSEPSAVDESVTASARQAAESWLALVDQGKYDESWDESSCDSSRPTLTC